MTSIKHFRGPGLSVSVQLLGDLDELLFDAQVLGRQREAAVAEQAVESPVDVRQDLEKVVTGSTMMRGSGS